MTALIFASDGGHADVVQVLCGAGVDKDAADKVGCRGAGHVFELRAAVSMAVNSGVGD